MLDAPTQHQHQLWVLQRLHRICLSFRNTTAWIEIIVQCLRTGNSFVPDEYMGTR